MDFIMKLPKKRSRHEDIMIVVEILTKGDQFIPVNTTHKETELADIYMKELAILHGILKVFVSYKDSKFTGYFWKGLFEGFGTYLNMSTSHHPQTDG